MQIKLKSLRVLGFIIFLSACSGTQEIAITTLEPAPVALSRTIDRVGIIASVFPEEATKDKHNKGLKMVLNKEDESFSRSGADAAMAGLLDELLKDPRFDTILHLKGETAVLEDYRKLPSETSWQHIRSLCEKHELDAIFTLAYCQAETDYSLKRTKMEERDLIRIQTLRKGHELSLETLIENGWRIYDPFNKEVLDEFVFQEQIISSGKGSSPLRAYKAIRDHRDSLLLKSRSIGKAYGSRIQPIEQTVYRTYYSQATANFSAANSKIEDGDWKGAVTLWKKEISHEKPRIRAQACYNLAVACEFQGDLQTAHDWALKSFEWQKNGNTKAYIAELESRMSQQALVQEQLAILGR